MVSALLVEALSTQSPFVQGSGTLVVRACSLTRLVDVDHYEFSGNTPTPLWEGLMQLPKAVLRHISDIPALKHIRIASDGLALDARSRCTAHRRWWAALTALALVYAVLAISRQRVSAASHPAHMQIKQDGSNQPQTPLSQHVNAVSHSRAGSWYNLFSATVPEVLDRWSDYERDAPDEPAGHTARHVPSRLMHKQTVWYRSVIDNTTRLNPAETRALKVSRRANASHNLQAQGRHAVAKPC